MATMFVAGEATGSSSGQTYDVINPATGEVVDSAPKGNEGDSRAAIDAAHAAFQAWSETAAEARAQLIQKGIETVKNEIQELSVLLTKEQGKPLGDSQREIEHFLHGITRWFHQFTVKRSTHVQTLEFGSLDAPAFSHQKLSSFKCI